jgi:hypothetical protein
MVCHVKRLKKGKIISSATVYQPVDVTIRKTKSHTTITIKPNKEIGLLEMDSQGILQSWNGLNGQK